VTTGFKLLTSLHLSMHSYYLFGQDVGLGASILDRMLAGACVEPADACEDKSLRSRYIVDVVLQIVKSLVTEGTVEGAKNWMQTFLTCGSWDAVQPSQLCQDDVWEERDMVEDMGSTFAAKVLTSKDHCILWMAYVHLIWFHELPSGLFMDPPNGYLSDENLFLIRWPTIEESEEENELHGIVHEIFIGLTLHYMEMDADARPSLVTTLKNSVGFLMARGSAMEEVLELVNPSNFPDSIQEIRDLYGQVLMVSALAFFIYTASMRNKPLTFFCSAALWSARRGEGNFAPSTGGITNPELPLEPLCSPPFWL